MRSIRLYTFEGILQTLSFFQKGKVTALGVDEMEARENAVRNLCRIHRLGPNCVHIGKCIKEEDFHDR